MTGRVATGGGVIVALGVLAAVALWPRADRQRQPPRAVDDTAATDEISRTANGAFRNAIAAVVRDVADGVAELRCPLPLLVPGSWRVRVVVYGDGELAGRATAEARTPCAALSQAVGAAVAGVERADRARFQFVVDLPGREYSLVVYEREGYELAHGLVVARELHLEDVEDRIAVGSRYLARVIDSRHHGVHKLYDARADRLDQRLYAVYTASTIYTLVKLAAYTGEESYLEQALRSSDFLLAMQSREPGDRSRGAFHYSLELATGAREARFPVGTTAKAIFSLLELSRLTGEPRFLAASRLAADWLVTMVRPDGSVLSVLSEQGRVWRAAKKQSVLYTGQTLSALARIYAAEGGDRYLQAADAIAARLAARVDKDGCLLTDDYRGRSPISTSWLVLALRDFARATGNARARAVSSRCARELLARQILNHRDVYRDGRWRKSLSSSGNGWLAEVLSELYLDCRAGSDAGCESYRDAIVRSLRLLGQFTYTPVSSYLAKAPLTAAGGLFWNAEERHVRTDSVCHALNAYVNIIPWLDHGVLVSLPEPPLVERLGLRAQLRRRQ